MLKEKELVFDYSALKGRAVEVFGTRGKFGKAMGWDAQQTSKKLNCKSYFTLPEIVKASKLLAIKDNQIKFYFLTPKV